MEQYIAMQLENQVLSIGTIYLDIHCLTFPIGEGLLKNKEIKGTDYLLSAGGSAFNFAKLCKHLGLHTSFIGKRGNDAMGDLVEHEIKKSGVEPILSIDSNAQTNIAVHYINEKGESIMTSCGSANQALDGDSVYTALEKSVANASFLYLGGCYKLKQLLPKYAQFAQLAQKNNVKVIVDHGRVNNSVTTQDMKYVHQLLTFTDFYLPSKDEFLQTWGVSSIQKGMLKARKVTAAEIIVKDSEHGAHVLKGSRMITIPSHTVAVMNTVGAGDSFNAGFILGTARGYTIMDSVRLANAVAATYISEPGLPSLKSINNYFEKEQ